MKTIKILIGLTLAVILNSCDTQANRLEYAEDIFIEEVSYMTEKEALAKGIDYYKAPQITVKEQTRSLTGKDLIYECNIVNKKNEEAMNDLRNGAYVVRTRNVSDIKEYALEYPDDIVAYEFRFSGTFTHYGKDKYGKQSATIVLIPKLNRYIITRNY